MTDTKDGERIAKVLSRAGIASRRDAERMIELGRIAVNGRTIDSPALNVTPADRITVDGQPLAPPEPARLWLYYKPEGLVTSASDEKGRDTVFDHLPEGLPRVMPVGRLDLNSEGLLLLTNDGELKRRLELPSTGWLRKYRVRVKGNPTDPDLEPLRKGITLDGENFQPMTVTLDRVQGANAWLTVGLREGRNREIRRAMSAIGLTVNRLIRISYGPFRLNELQPGEVEEIRPRVLRDQLGEATTPEPRPDTRKGDAGKTGTAAKTGRRPTAAPKGARPPRAALPETAIDAAPRARDKGRPVKAATPTGGKAGATPGARPPRPQGGGGASKTAGPTAGKAGAAPGARPPRPQGGGGAGKTAPGARAPSGRGAGTAPGPRKTPPKGGPRGR
ncbi:pseudouridine synthase [Cereibacter ovatus]|uniref:Pseudouridine synthase n=1 Tax=Cereibacter ovatus TaxID=439529 RepID=A0A285CKC5_9RHOB|nr:pseudouridine synthase [Cereibacter ovatus]SNX67476.1 pseudouridine synthase [Cereibacter ovatus]